MAFELNEPTKHHQTLSLALFEKIKQRLNSSPLLFKDYMELILYEPGLGYYCNDKEKFGSFGDFITAPLLSPLFARLIARACVFLKEYNEPCILEIGAGTGQLAFDLMQSLMKRGQKLKNYYILEISPSLRAQQQRLLAEVPCSVVWLEKLPSSPFQGLVLMNEVIDALPAHRFVYQNNTLFEEYVRIVDNKLIPYLGSPSPEVLQLELPESVTASSMPYASEYISGLKEWLAPINDCLEAGSILIIDYGFPEREFYHPARHQGTLMCHFQHHSHDNPYLYPGLQDVTTHVNFTELARIGHRLDLEIGGYTSLAYFLLNLGLTEELETIADQQAAQTLSSPAEMGELFKVLALYKNRQAIPGFEQFNKVYSL